MENKQKYVLKCGRIQLDADGNGKITFTGSWNLLNNFNLMNQSWGLYHDNVYQEAFEQQLGTLTLEELSHANTRIVGTLDVNQSPASIYSYMAVLWLDN